MVEKFFSYSHFLFNLSHRIYMIGCLGQDNSLAIWLLEIELDYT